MRFSEGDRVEINSHEGYWGRAVVLGIREDGGSNYMYRCRMDDETKARIGWKEAEFWEYEYAMSLLEGAPMASYGDGSRWDEI